MVVFDLTNENHFRFDSLTDWLISKGESILFWWIIFQKSLEREMY